MPETKQRTRNVLVVDNSHVARRVGDRIRQARLRANLTQAQVAKGRYTAAYVSALERGLAKPSMAALTFLSERLGVPVPDLVSEERPAVARLEADLLLAAGDFQAALDRYDSLLDGAGDDRRQRADLLRGRAEALCRMARGRDAIRPAAESAELFEGLGAGSDAALARYWLAVAHYRDDNPAEARSILHELLAADRKGLQVAPDFRFRVLTALGHVEVWDGESNRALAYMEEARALLDGASIPQRAAFLAGVALQHRATGDLERAIRVGHEALALHRVADMDHDVAALEINIGLTLVDLGTVDRASEHLGRARALADAQGDATLLSEVAEAEARLALARGDDDGARARAMAALQAAEGGGSYLAAVGAHVTLGRLAQRAGDRGSAEKSFASAAELLRARHASARLREILAEWADLRSRLGDLEGANALYAEALGRSGGARRSS